MSNQGFTPGPWVVQRAADAYCIASVGNLVIMPSSGKVKHDNTEADARLIAAAPDLLEALEMIVAEADSYTARTGKPVYNWLDQARAAIAKARGTPC
ncbi:hypothetical protein KXR63_00660 [Stutzerimonas chloritidismutans]|uniref:hypothetical protein n=1 Tax=Stutzerimonas chloritidismutans TaxID=203192 RepID=UPI003F16C9CF